LVLDATVRDVDPGLLRLVDANTLVVANKIDLAASPFVVPGHVMHGLSAKTGAGLDAFVGVLQAEVGARLAMSDTAAPVITRARHREALADCAAALDRALAGTAEELIAEDVRLAARALGRITGRVGVEDVLDLIFREFCIGK